MPLPELIVVSVSGATATGKTTLLSALHRRLSAQFAVGCVERTESFSLRLWERWQDGDLPSAPRPVKTFDEIDSKGHRDWFQRQLPESLCFEVEIAAQKIRNEGKRKNYILADRWFPDVMAFTRLHMAGDAREIDRRQIRRLCAHRHEQLLTDLGQHFRLVFLSVFIPIESCDFTVVGQSKKFRATSNRDAWQAACLEEWPAIVGSLPSLTLSTSPVDSRVRDIMMAVATARKSPYERQQSSPS